MLETQGMTESASKNRGCVEIMSRKRSKAQSCQCFHLFKLVKVFESRNEKEVRADYDTMNT